MEVEISVEDKNKKITIPSVFGDVKIEAVRTAIVKVDGTPVYSIIYTKNSDFMAVVPPMIMKIKDIINFSEVFDTKNYGELSPHIKKTIIPAMAAATGYDNIEKFIEEKLINIEVHDYTGKDHEEQIYSNAIIVTATIGEHKIITAWKKMDTPSGPTVSRFIITKGLKAYGEKTFISQTYDELVKLPYADKETLKNYAIKYTRELAKNNLVYHGLI